MREVDGVVVRVGADAGATAIRGGDRRAHGRGVIGPSGAVRVMLATLPIDFRKGMDGLALMVSEVDVADRTCPCCAAPLHRIGEGRVRMISESWSLIDSELQSKRKAQL